MKKEEAIKNLKYTYEKDWEAIIYLLKESEKGYNSIDELKTDIYNVICNINEYYRNFFDEIYKNYFDPGEKKLLFKKYNPNISVKEKFIRIDYKTTECLLKNYDELKDLIKLEETNKFKKLDNYLKLKIENGN